MNAAGNKLLARTGFTCDQYGGFRPRRLRHQLVHDDHGRTSSNQPRRARIVHDVVPIRFECGFPPRSEMTSQEGDYLHHFEWLGDEVASASRYSFRVRDRSAASWS